MKDNSDDPRAAAILQSAWKAFAAYGFRKTSMDDIARGAAMSRPALYLHYRNKEEIFRHLVQHYYDDATEAVGRALDGDGTVPERLARAFDAQGGAIIEAMLTSRHGLELLDAGNANAADIVTAGEARLREIYRQWLVREAASGRVCLPGDPAVVAETLTVALKGIKGASATYAAYQARARMLAALIGAGLAEMG